MRPAMHRQERQQVVAAALAELLAQRRRPVERPRPPNCPCADTSACLPGQRPGVGDQRLDHRVPVALERARVEHVERVALPAVAARRDAANGRRGCSRSGGSATSPAGTSQRSMPSCDRASRSGRARLAACVSSSPGAAGNSCEQRRGVRRGEVQRLVQGLLLPSSGSADAVGRPGDGPLAESR